MEGSRWRRWLDLLVALSLGAAALALYASTLAPTVLAGDGGEFQFVPYVLGVAHPTGYPLYTLLGWLWSHLLPVGDVAYRMNLFSAFAAAAAVALLYPTTRALLRQAFASLSATTSRLIAVLAAVTFAVTPTLWSQAVIAEVYGLHILLVVLILYSLLTWGERRLETSHLHAGGNEGEAFLLLTAFAFGLGLGHHRTTLLLAPAILAYVWLVDRAVFRSLPFMLKSVLFVLLPLVLYLYIPLRAPHTPYLRLPLAGDHELVLYENTWSGFVGFVLGGPFGGSIDLSVDLGERVSMSWGFLRDEVGYIGLILALIGLAHLTLGRPAAVSRRGCWAVLALTGLTYVVSVAFNLVYTIGDVYVLYIPSYLTVVLWLAIGVATVASLSRGRTGVSVLVALLCFVVPVWLAITGYANADQGGKGGIRARWETMLAEPLPPHAVLVSNDRNQIMPMWYFQYVEGKRPDLLGLFPLITPDYPYLGAVLDLALSTGRPVYLIKEMPGIEVKVEVEPEGRLWRVLGPAAAEEPHYPRAVQFEDALALIGYGRSPHSPRPGETLHVSLYWEALRPLNAEYHSFVHLLDAEGRVVAQSDGQPGGVYYPTILWRPDERLRDDHFLALPADLPEGVYRLLAGVYALSGDATLEPLGEPTIIGQVGVKRRVATEPGDTGQPVGADFGGQIELLGYKVDERQGTLVVTLYWRGLRSPETDYTVFVHLLNGTDEAVTQHDGQPQGGTYPTSVWEAGEVVIDEHVLSLPEGLSPGGYRLRVGLYLFETGERLPVEGAGDSIELGPVGLRDGGD